MFQFHRIGICGVFSLVLTTVAPGQSRPATLNNPGVPWPATDGLGRILPVPVKAGEPPVRAPAARWLGIFYFLWLNEVDNKSPQGGPYDVARILAADPQALAKPESPLWGPIGRSHYWGEPLYGYY